MSGPMHVRFFSLHCILIHAAAINIERRNFNLELLMIADLLSIEENQ